MRQAENDDIIVNSVDTADAEDIRGVLVTFGEFIACSNYPKCKNTRQISKSVGVKCPMCGSDIVSRHGKNRSFFYSCESYPTCKFVSWDLPVPGTCPDCGKPLYLKKGKDQLICKEKVCGYKKDLTAEEAAEMLGIPSVVIAGSGFVTQAKATARSAGIARLRIAEYPGAFASHTRDELLANTEKILYSLRIVV